MWPGAAQARASGPRWATSRPRLASKVTPSPQSGHGAYKGTLWDPVAKIGAGQVARNSNLKLGDRPRLGPTPNGSLT